MIDNKEGMSPLYRIIDANLNRLKEGIRVCEDIQRYCFNDKTKAYILKDLRHRAVIKDYKKLLDSRDIKNDPLKKTTKDESERENIKQILTANIKRAQESSRVLEEMLKLIDINEAEKFKQIRYNLYHIEKKFFDDEGEK